METSRTALLASKINRGDLVATGESAYVVKKRTHLKKDKYYKFILLNIANELSRTYLIPDHLSFYKINIL